MEWLEEAYRRIRKSGAAGVDGVTAAEYEVNLGRNLQSLLNRAKSGNYYAPPVRRVHIAKGTSGTETRPIGIPTLEDKILQRAVLMVLEAVYEQDFLEGSYGFRPGRSAHQMLEALWKHLMKMDGGYVIEIDIRKFFDSVDHSHLREILSRRVRDGVLVRLIGKWLNAGVMENDEISYAKSGTPQGGVISPMVSNAFLHDVLDVWFEREVKPVLGSPAKLFRFADDAMMVFSSERDAQRVMNVLPKRFAKYGLTLHPEKTRLLCFLPGNAKTASFSLLGFTHVWGKSRRGSWFVKRTTESKRFGAALKKVGDWCHKNRHQPIPEQHRQLSQKLKGHYSYYGITGNSKALGRFRYEVERLWKKWLSRRSWKTQQGWDWFNPFLHRHSLPPAIAIHSTLRRAANV